MIYSLKNVVNILMITLQFLFIFSVMGVQLFSVCAFSLLSCIFQLLNYIHFCNFFWVFGFACCKPCTMYFLHVFQPLTSRPSVKAGMGIGEWNEGNDGNAGSQGGNAENQGGNDGNAGN